MATTTQSTAPAPRSAEEERLIALRRKEKRQERQWRLIGYVVVLGVWELASGLILDENLLPGPMRILETIPEIWGSGRLAQSFGATLTRIGIGFALAFMVGAFIGIITQSRWWEGFFKDAVTISLVTPGLVWALTGLVIWGFAPLGWIFAIVFTTFAVITVNIAEGIKALPKDLIDMSTAFGVSSMRRQRDIVIPHLAPFLFTAIRFGFSLAWKVTVLTEVFSSNEGIGFEMRVASQLFRMDEFFTWVLLFFVFALFLEKVVLQYFEDRFFRWRPEVQAS